MTESERERFQLGRLSALAREAASAEIAAEMQARGRRRVIDAAAQWRDRPAEPRRSLVWIGVAIAIALSVVVGVRLRPLPLAYEVTGAKNFASDYVSAKEEGPAKIQFSDGSRVIAAPGSRLRIDATTRNGATMLIERGVASAEIVHRNGSAWRFLAGPFEIKVTGTRFTATWDPRALELDLVMLEGSVEVQSPIGEGHFAVRTGQRFHASLPDGSTKLEAVGARAEVSVVDRGPRALPVPTVEAAPPVPPVAPPSASGEAEAVPWSDLVREGKFQTVVLRATRLGVEPCLSSCNSTDLRALGDAARYTRRTDLATKTFLALRKRFSSSHGSTAAFLLGRTQESIGQEAAAEEWYRVYLREAPEGEFAAEAAAGRMRTVAALKGSLAARPLALEYLARYPKGAYASAARTLSESH